MELPNLGKQCTEATCKQLDFLPLKCKCGQLYCPEHFQKHAETCTAVVQPKDVELKKIEGLYVCSEEGCKSTSVVPIICERCNKHFCITHRHLTECRQKTAEELAIEKERYAEPVRRFNEAKKIVDGQVTEKLENAKKKPKSSQMASKVQLMRIKGKATGNKGIPTTDRVYFNIEHPKTLPPKSTPVFVSKTWTVGKFFSPVNRTLCTTKLSALISTCSFIDFFLANVLIRIFPNIQIGFACHHSYD